MTFWLFDARISGTHDWLSHSLLLFFFFFLFFPPWMSNTFVPRGVRRSSFAGTSGFPALQYFLPFPSLPFTATRHPFTTSILKKISEGWQEEKNEKEVEGIKEPYIILYNTIITFVSWKNNTKINFPRCYKGFYIVKFLLNFFNEKCGYKQVLCFIFLLLFPVMLTVVQHSGR